MHKPGDRASGSLGKSLIKTPSLSETDGLAPDFGYGTMDMAIHVSLHAKRLHSPTQADTVDVKFKVVAFMLRCGPQLCVENVSWLNSSAHCCLQLDPGDFD